MQEPEDTQASPSIVPSAGTSPIFPALNTTFSTTSTTPSPVIMPGEDRSPEETAAALLMLGYDRRGSLNGDTRETSRHDGTNQKGRGMSVKDLLTC